MPVPAGKVALLVYASNALLSIGRGQATFKVLVASEHCICIYVVVEIDRIVT